jgi:hypothetical protein
MTPAEHYRIAERLLARTPAPTDNEAARAQAHAALALAGVYAMHSIDMMGPGEYRSWHAIGTGK